MTQTHTSRAAVDLRPGDHFSFLYETEKEHRAVLGPFLRQGLARGEKILYVLDTHDQETILGYLRDAPLAGAEPGPDVELCLASGQLTFLDGDDVAARCATLTPQDILSMLKTLTAQALVEGYSALRITDEITWALGGPSGSKWMIEYESRANEFFPSSRCMALCQYERRRFDASVLLDVLRVHPTVIIGTKVYANFYYIPPAELLGEDVPAAELRRWVDNLAQSKRVEGDLKTYRDRLEERVKERTAELDIAIEQLEREITERAQVEKALRDSERRHRLLAENSCDMISRHNPEGDFTFVSPACRALFGYEPEEMVGRSAFDFFHPDDAKRLRRKIVEALEDPLTYSSRHRIHHKEDGVYVWCEATARTVRDPKTNRPTEIIAVTRDITAQMQAERALRQHNRVLALLNQASRALNVTLDLDQVLAITLKEVQRLLGAVACSVWLIDPTTGELVCRQATGPRGETVRGWRLAPGEGVAGWVARNGESLIVPDTQADTRHFKGVDAQIGLTLRSILSVPLRIKEHVIGALQATDTAVDRFQTTDRTLLELLAATAAMAIENAQLYEQTRQDAETKSLLLREVNHRVKNNLTAIIGLLYTARRQAKTDEAATCRSIMNELIGRVRGLATVHGLLSESGWEPLKLSHLAAQVIRASLQLLPRDKHLSINVLPSPVRVTAGQAHNLALVVNELATNTIKYALQERDTAQVVVSISLDGDGVCCEFRDDGPGYPQAVLQPARGNVGFELVQNIVRDNLEGELSLHNDQGAVAVIQFKAKTN